MSLLASYHDYLSRLDLDLEAYAAYLHKEQVASAELKQDLRESCKMLNMMEKKLRQLSKQEICSAGASAVLRRLRKLRKSAYGLTTRAGVKLQPFAPSLKQTSCKLLGLLALTLTSLGSSVRDILLAGRVGRSRYLGHGTSSAKSSSCFLCAWPARVSLCGNECAVSVLSVEPTTRCPLMACGAAATFQPCLWNSSKLAPCCRLGCFMSNASLHHRAGPGQSQACCMPCPPAEGLPA